MLLGEAAAVLPSTLYHATIKTAIPAIEQNGLQPQQGALWKGDQLIFATDDKHRRKLVAVMLHKIANTLGKNMNKITAEDVLRDGAVAVITDTHLFQRAQGRGRPIKHIEAGDYYADQPVPVSRFMTQHEMMRFLGPQFRIWTKLVAQGEA